MRDYSNGKAFDMTLNQLLQEADPQLLLDLARKHIAFKYGAYYSVTRDGDIFTAKPTPKAEAPSVQELIESKEAREATPLNVFVEAHLAKYEKGSSESRLATRIATALNSEARENKRSLEDFLTMRALHARRIRNFGDLCYVKVYDEMKQLGFKVETFPAFAEYQNAMEKIAKKAKK